MGLDAGRRGRTTWAWLMLALSLAALQQAQALAFRGPPAELLLQCSPGRASHAKQVLGAVSVANTGDEPIDVAMRLVAVGPGELKDGYEPIEKISWLRLSQPLLKIGFRLDGGLEPGDVGRIGVRVVIGGAGDVVELSADGDVGLLGLQAGDRVLFSKYGGTEVKLDGEDYLIMREDDILGVVEG